MKLKHLLITSLCALALQWPAASARAAAETLPYSTIPDPGAPGTYQFDGKTVHAEFSQYAGYSGLILANGGLIGTDDSYLFTKHKIKLNIALTETQDWSRVNSGKVGVVATTADVLAAYRNRLSTQVISLIDYSRGADEIVALKGISSIRDLVGKTVVVTMFDETEFFIRKLCYDNSLEVNTRDSVASPPAKNKVNLIFSPSSDEIPGLFAKLSADPSTGVAACATWLPFTTDAVTESKGRAAVLMTNKNQLFIADVLMANQGFCAAHPKAISAINDALVHGNRELQKLIDAKTGNDKLWSLLTTSLTVDAADPYDRDTLHGELTRMQFATARLNAEFLGGDTRVGAGFADIFSDASKFYDEKVAGPNRPFNFVDPKVVAGFIASSFYDKNEAPMQTISTANEKPEMDNPTVKRDFKFRFALGIYDKFDLEKGENRPDFAILEKAIKERPGSIIRLTGHLDTTKVKENGADFAKKYSGQAKQSSIQRAETIKQLLIDTLSVSTDRVEAAGLGWERPISKNPIENARVEVEIFALE
jgi:NitT/TauT family transport system substrate-binding protein